jgi:hypothetical protein
MQINFIQQGKLDNKHPESEQLGGPGSLQSHFQFPGKSSSSLGFFDTA